MKLPRKAVSDTAVLSFSLANLLSLRVWARLQTPKGWSDVVTRADYAAAIVNLLLGTAVIWCLATFAQRSKNRFLSGAARFGLLSLTLMGLWVCYSVIWPSHPLLKLLKPFFATGHHAAVAVILLAAACAILSKQDRLIRISKDLLRISFPIGMFFALMSAYNLMTYTPADKPFLHPNRGHNSAGSPRVVVLLFDEMDQRLAFVERPLDLKLPEFDRFRGESVFADNAFAPSNSTEAVIPTFFTDKLIESAEMLQSGGLLITPYKSKNRLRFRACPTLLSEVRKMGLKSAIVSDTIPYRHMLGEQPDFVYSHYATGKRSSSLMASILRQLRVSFDVYPFVEESALDKLIETRRERETYVDSYRNVMSISKDVLADGRYDFTFVHLCMPHEPFIYNRSKADFSADRGNSYSDNLALADKTLGELRSTMEAAGRWDSSTVIVISDHWWRKRPGKARDHRAVFMVKMPGQRSSLRYDTCFNTIVFHDLVLALLHGKLQSPGSVAGWIDEHRSFGESPLTRSLP